MTPEEQTAFDRHGKLPRHPVDALKVLGVPMTPEFEAQARAYCDEVVEMPQEMPARFQHSERSAIATSDRQLSIAVRFSPG